MTLNFRVTMVEIAKSKSALLVPQRMPSKRVFDVLFSLFALAVTFPLFMLISFAIRLTSPGKVIYAHERLGRGGKPFKCYKFRTMYANADEKLRHLLRDHPEVKQEWERSYKLKNDPRITPVGRFLRKTSLDELPQFLNVLKGDLSVVGPRPIVQQEAEKYVKEKTPLLLSIKPGLTGLWQVSGRSNTSYERRIELDLLYIEKQSLLLDCKLILKTLPAMFSRDGAY